MEVFTTPDAMRDWSRRARADGFRIGVVPTMGALHEGHLALVAATADRADRVVVTIFVNPLQFNQAVDFDAYPRPIDDDLATCAVAGVDAVYAPTAATMYPAGFQTHVEPGGLADRLEGPMRPGHFRGVATVVMKLIGATDPDVAAFGQKDFQQLAIIRRMFDDLDTGVEIVAIPIVREADGLALSSRNVRLTPPDRAAATVLHRALEAGAAAWSDGVRDAAAIRRVVRDRVESEPRASLEYVELAEAATLRPIAEFGDQTRAVLLIAAWFGEVRLIDNCTLGH